jgi:hypothetical protein
MHLIAIQARPQTGLPVAQYKLIERISKGFSDGICIGYLTYYDEYLGKPLTDLDVYVFLAQNIMDIRGTNAFNAGYCTGWIEALLEEERCCTNMTIRGRVQSLVQINDPDFQAGFEEAQELYYADRGRCTDLGLVEVVRAMLTEVAVERGLSGQQLLRSTGFIIGILSRG